MNTPLSSAQLRVIAVANADSLPHVRENLAAWWNETAGADVREAFENATFTSAVDELNAIRWLPDERPQDVPETAWQPLLAGAQEVTVNIDRRLGIGTEPTPVAGRIGVATVPVLGEAAGSVFLRLGNEDGWVGLVVLIGVTFDFRTMGAFWTSPARLTAPPIERPRQFMRFEARTAESFHFGDKIWPLALDLAEFVGFAIGGPWGMTFAGGAHLVSAILRMRETGSPTMSFSQIVSDQIATARIKEALDTIHLVGKDYSAYLNSASDPMKNLTYWAKAYDQFFTKNALRTGDLGTALQTLSSEMISRLSQPVTSRSHLWDFRAAMSGFAVGAGLYSNLLLDLHARDVALVNLGSQDLAKAGDADPFELGSDDVLTLVQVRTAWLKETLDPFLEEAIKLVSETVKPRLDDWWKARSARHEIRWNCPHGVWELVDLGDPAYDGHEGFMASRGGGPESDEVHRAALERSWSSNSAPMLRRMFLSNVFGEGYQEGRLDDLLEAWRSTRRKIGLLAKLDAEDVREQLESLRKKLRDKGMKNPGMLPSNVHHVRWITRPSHQ